MLIVLSIPHTVWPVSGCVLFFGGLLTYFLWENRGGPSFYFDPKDFLHYEQGAGRELPVSAKDTTFEPHLKNYIDVMKLLVTIAAASIAFGGIQNGKSGVVMAKLILACAILYGVVFCGLLQFFYDEYTQNVRAYTRFRYSVIEALGFSALVCFIIGYFVWAFSLG
jgi:hypothetical protein